MKKRLVTLMRQHNISRDALAEYTGIPKAEIVSWLTTMKMPDYFSLIRLADFFEVSLDYLCERTNQNKILDEQTDGIRIAKMAKRIDELTNSLAAMKKTITGLKAESKYTDEERDMLIKFSILTDFKKTQVTGFIEMLLMDAPPSDDGTPPLGEPPIGEFPLEEPIDSEA